MGSLERGPGGPPIKIDVTSSESPEVKISKEGLDAVMDVMNADVQKAGYEVPDQPDITALQAQAEREAGLDKVGLNKDIALYFYNEKQPGIQYNQGLMQNIRKDLAAGSVTKEQIEKAIERTSMQYEDFADDIDDIINNLTDEEFDKVLALVRTVEGKDTVAESIKDFFANIFLKNIDNEQRYISFFPDAETLKDIDWSDRLFQELHEKFTQVFGLENADKIMTRLDVYARTLGEMEDIIHPDIYKNDLAKQAEEREIVVPKAKPSASVKLEPRPSKDELVIDEKVYDKYDEGVDAGELETEKNVQDFRSYPTSFKQKLD